MDRGGAYTLHIIDPDDVFEVKPGDATVVLHVLVSEHAVRVEGRGGDPLQGAVEAVAAVVLDDLGDVVGGEVVDVEVKAAHWLSSRRM